MVPSREFLDRRALLWIATVLAVAFVALSVLVVVEPAWLGRWEADVSERWAGAGPQGFLKVIGRAGTSTVAASALVVALALLWRRAPRLAIAYLGAMTTTVILVPLLKTVIDRPRPDESIIGVDLASYPSGHSTLVVVLATFVTATVAALARPRDGQGWTLPRWLPLVTGVVLTAVVLITLVGRVLLGAHWPTDIIGGGLFGGALSAVALAWAWTPATGHRREGTVREPSRLGGP